MPTDSTINFLWHSRESGEGESTFGPENVAEITFLDDGKLKGSMYWDCLGDFDLVGKRDDRLTIKDKSEVNSWKYEFRNLNEQHYERDSRGRWGGGGGWYGGDEEERELKCDTSVEDRDKQCEDSEDLDESESGDSDASNESLNEQNEDDKNSDEAERGHIFL